jgi:hypothetical protein
METPTAGSGTCIFNDWCHVQETNISVSVENRLLFEFAHIYEGSLYGREGLLGDTVVVGHGRPLTDSHTNVDNRGDGYHQTQEQFSGDLPVYASKPFPRKPFVFFGLTLIAWCFGGWNIFLRGAAGCRITGRHLAVSLLCFLLGIFALGQGIILLNASILGAECASVFFGSVCASAPTYGRADCPPKGESGSKIQPAA